MCQEDISHLKSAMSSADVNDDSTLCSDDSGSSTRASDIDALEKELDSLRHTGTVIAQQYAEFLKKTSFLEERLQQKKNEREEYQIELEKQRELLNELETEIEALRRETGMELEQLELRLLLVKNFIKQKKRQQAPQAVTEAGFKGLRHADRTCTKFKEQHDANMQRKLELIRQVKGCMIKVAEFEIDNRDSGLVDSDTITSPKLGFSPVITSAYIMPIEAQGEQKETEELVRPLSTLEKENEHLLTDYTRLSDSHCELLAHFDAQVECISDLSETNFRLTMQNENLISQLEAQTQVLHTDHQDTEQQVAQGIAELTTESQPGPDPLEPQIQRPYSTFSDPDFVASLQDAQGSIYSPFQTPAPTIPCNNSHCPGFVTNTAPAAPDVTLNITVEPSNTGLWSLLRHIHRNPFWTSLNIEGPQYVAQEFLDSIDEANREFEEQAERVARLERALEDRDEEIERLREWWRC